MPPEIITKKIVFEKNREALAALPAPNITAEEIAAALKVKPPAAVLLIIGGADNLDEKVSSRLIQLFGRGIARAAADMNALIIDGGTESGVMKMMGQGVADRGNKSALIGVAPLGLITYPGSDGAGTTPLDPNHSHFVLVEGKNWGDETSTIFKLMDWFKSKAPAVVVLAGGGNVTKHEVLQAVRQNLPIIVVEGSGGVADEIAAAWKAKPDLPDDPEMAEIIADGRLEFHLLNYPVKGAERLILRLLGGDNVLLQAWERFAVYDFNAGLLQKKFYRLQLTILMLGLLATALALVKERYDRPPTVPPFAQASPSSTPAVNSAVQPSPAATVILGTAQASPGATVIPGAVQPSPATSVPPPANGAQSSVIWGYVYYILLIIPIVLTILITAANRFKQGNKWLLLRSGAEAIKREIYKYRARACDYNGIAPAPLAGSPPAQPPTAEEVLALKVEEITRRVMQTEVNTSALLPYDGGLPPNMDFAQGGDDGSSLLTPDNYLQLRLGDQLGYYRGKTIKLERKLKRIQWTIYIIGGLGTFLAAINQQVWIALTTAMAAALATYLSYQQTENTLTKYNQASTDLDSVKRWWTALPAEEQVKQENVDALVGHTEKVLQSELDGWIQQMQNALEQLRKAQAPTDAERAAAKAAADEEAAKKKGNGENGKGGDEGADANQGAAGNEGADANEGAAGNEGANANEGADANEGAAGNEGAGGNEGANANEGADANEGAAGNEGAGGNEGANANEGADANEGAAGNEGAGGNEGGAGENAATENVGSDNDAGDDVAGNDDAKKDDA
jgi:Skp family chaperone for outer membrane proteins